MTIELKQRLRRKLGRRILPLLILATAMLVAVVLFETRPRTEPISVQEKAWLVSAQPVQPAQRAPSVTLYGKVESLWTSTLKAGISADVVSVKVIAGDSVRQGDVLVILDDRDAKLSLQQGRAAVERAEARIRSEMLRHGTDQKILPREKSLLALAQKEVDRLQGLVQKQLTSQSVLDTARQNVERQAISVNKIQQGIDDHPARLSSLHADRLQAQAQRDKAALERQRATIVAPFDGRIAEVFVSPGTRVRVGDRLLRIFDRNALVFRTLIPNQYLPIVADAVATGRQLQVQGDIDGRKIRGKLRSLAAEVASGGGGVEALFSLDGDHRVVQQGRVTRVQLTLPPQPDLIALPPEAIYGSSTLYRLGDDQRLQRLSVQRIGETLDEQGNALILVRSDDLRAGDLVVTTQLPSAVDGLKVERTQ